jgi:hypothetical protein
VLERVLGIGFFVVGVDGDEPYAAGLVVLLKLNEAIFDGLGVRAVVAGEDDD